MGRRSSGRKSEGRRWARCQAVLKSDCRPAHPGDGLPVWRWASCLLSIVFDRRWRSLSQSVPQPLRGCSACAAWLAHAVWGQAAQVYRHVRWIQVMSSGQSRDGGNPLASRESLLHLYMNLLPVRTLVDPPLEHVGQARYGTREQVRVPLAGIDHADKRHISNQGNPRQRVKRWPGLGSLANV
jgi:hypothetical protein